MRKLLKKISSGEILLSIVVFGFCLLSGGSARAEVVLLRVPNGGIQPQAAVDENGIVHLIYFGGNAAHGDLFYTRSADGGINFQNPLRVNTREGSAVALGNIRGARIALGREGQVYVVWNGSQQMASASGGKTPLLFTRLNKTRTAFEPERNVIQSAFGIDGGSGVAADPEGHVYVFWHAPGAGLQGEASRRVWMARSDDDGTSFEREKPVWNKETGVCGCCSLNAFADRRGKVYLLYRAASNVVHRDIYLLHSDDFGGSFSGSDISKWDVSYCAMSAESFTQGPAGVQGAWETQKQVYLARIAGTNESVSAVSPSGVANNRKYPSLAENAQGQTLLAWTEGMGWKRGGSVHWQIFDRSEKPLSSAGQADGVPVWSTVAAIARKDGSFAVLY